MNIWPKEDNTGDNKKNEVLSFNDYLALFSKNPEQQCRPTYLYFKDMLEHFGRGEEGELKLFEADLDDAPPIFGQSIPEKQIFDNLLNFSEEGINNKFILLVGPNGSSKSSLVRKMMKGAEEYSKTEEGALYSFSWIFPIDTFVRGSLGLAATPASQDINSYAYLDDKDITAILGSELKDHPLLLIPVEDRKKILSEHFKNSPQLFEKLEKSYFFKGDLSKRNRMIYDALLKNYKGSHKEVLKHIRVERFNISRRYSSGAVTIEPQIHIDARMQQITMDKRLASLPPSLQSLNLFSLQGEAVLANRGILEFSDLLKRPLDTYKYLLQTMETSSLNLQGILTELDIFFIGTSNEVHLSAFKQHPDFNSFKGRFNFIRVPYLLDYKKEMRIYEEQIRGLKEKSHFGPHALEALCLFAILTRLRQPQIKNYEDKKLANIVTNLNPLEKALFIAGDILPGRLDSESAQLLKSGKKNLLQEFINENLYEGKFGLSPRDVKNLIYQITSQRDNITFVEVLELLHKTIQLKGEYEFLSMTPQADYHHPMRFIHLIKEFCLEKIDNEVRDSLGMVDDRSYEEYIRKYIENINALIKNEKIRNTVTGRYEDSNDYFIKEFEKNIGLKEDVTTFRSHLISKLGAYYLDNPARSIVYMDVFPELVKRLKESFRDEQRKIIKNVASNILYFEAEKNNERDKNNAQTPLSKENRELIQKTFNNLMKNYGHTEAACFTLIKYLIKEKY